MRTINPWLNYANLNFQLAIATISRELIRIWFTHVRMKYCINEGKKIADSKGKGRKKKRGYILRATVFGFIGFEGPVFPKSATQFRLDCRVKQSDVQIQMIQTWIWHVQRNEIAGIAKRSQIVEIGDHVLWGRFNKRLLWHRARNAGIVFIFNFQWCFHWFLVARYQMDAGYKRIWYSVGKSITDYFRFAMILLIDFEQAANESQLWADYVKGLIQELFCRLGIQKKFSSFWRVMFFQPK